MADLALAVSADLSTLDRVALEALIAAQQKTILAKDEALAAQQEKLLSRDNEIEHLKLVIAKLRRMIFGTKSEKVTPRDRAVGTEARRTGDTARPTRLTATSRRQARQRRLSRCGVRCLNIFHVKCTRMCPPKMRVPDCGGQLRKLGEDVSEILERVPATSR